MNEDFIEIIEPIHPAGSIALSGQNGQNLGNTHGPLKNGGVNLEARTTIKKIIIEGDVEEKDTPGNEATNEEHTKKRDRVVVDEEKDNNNEYKHDFSDWNISNEINKENTETLVRPAGSVAPVSHRNNYMEYVQNPIEYEEATLDLKTTEVPTDSITWKRTKSDKVNNEAFEMPSISEETSKIDTNKENMTSSDKRYAKTEKLDKVNPLTANGHQSLDKNMADSITQEQSPINSIIKHLRCQTYRKRPTKSMLSRRKQDIQI